MNETVLSSTQLSETERRILTDAGLTVGSIDIELPLTRMIHVTSPGKLIKTRLVLPRGEDAEQKLLMAAEGVIASEQRQNGKDALWALTQDSGRFVRDPRHGTCTLRYAGK